MLAVADLVELLEEIDRLQVLVAAEHVGDPLARLARVVEVKHRGHRIDPEAVEVVAVEPEQRVAEEEVAHLGTAVVEDLGAPVAVFAQPRVGVLVEMGAVEVPQAVQIVGEVRGDPVENHAEAVAMQVIDEVGEVVGRAMPGGRREIANRLVAPASVKRMLGDRQQLDVGELGVLEVRGQVVGQLAIVQEAGRRFAALFP